MKYEEALEELELIVEQIESADISIDDLSEKVKRASKLISVCKDILSKTDKEVKSILDNLEKTEE